MRASFLRSAAFLVMMTVILVGWGSSLNSRQDSGSSILNQVDRLPYVEFKGIGPSTFTLTDPADAFLVKTGPNINEIRQESYTASDGQYVWEISGDINQFIFFLSGVIDLKTVVEEGCRVQYVHIDDESDQRLNRFTINGEVVHTINPEQVPDPEGLVIYSEFVAPTTGALGFRVEDSGGLSWRVICSGIELEKTANPTQVGGSGEPVEFSVRIENTGRSEVTVTSLVDDQFGDLNGKGDCSVPQTIAIGGVYTCTFTEPVTFDEDSCVHTNVINASGEDADGEPFSDSDDADVTRAPCAAIKVSKTPNPAVVEAPGGDVQFTVVVANTSPVPVTIESLTDDVFGDLNGQGSCSVPQTIAVGGSYECVFTGAVTVEEGSCVHINTVTASGVSEDQETVQGSDDARVDIKPCAEISVTKSADPAELPLPGGDVVFTVVVANTGSAPVTIDSLVDDVFGDLNGQGTCSVPQEIPVEGSYECSFTGTVELSEDTCPHINTVSASGPGVEGQDDAVVECLDLQIEVSKSANPTTLPIPGGNVAYTVVVANTGLGEVVIDSLTDDKFGDLNGQGSCSVPQTIPVGGTYECTFTGTVTFSETVCTHTNTVTATGPGLSGQDSATVTCTPLPPPPSIKVVKIPNPVTLPKPGGDVAYTIRVSNEGEQDVTIDSLTDDKFGNLNGQGDCSVPQTIPVGGSYSCTFTAKVTLDEATCSHSNTVTAAGPNVSSSGSATVSCEVKDRKPACLRINFEIGPDSARRGTFVVRETGGHLLATWWAEEGWMDSGWIEDIDISAPAVYVQVIFVKGDGTEIEMKILNPAPDTPYGWLARGQCHALEVAWP